MVDSSLLLSVMEDVMETSRMETMSWRDVDVGLEEEEEGVTVAGAVALGGVTGVAVMGCCC